MEKFIQSVKSRDNGFIVYFAWMMIWFSCTPAVEAVNLIFPAFSEDFTITKHLPCHALRCDN